jgi:hypothetical protein
VSLGLRGKPREAVRVHHAIRRRDRLAARGAILGARESRRMPPHSRNIKMTADAQVVTEMIVGIAGMAINASMSRRDW